MKPQFLTFEGVEGCGKTTQSNLLVEWLQSKNIPAIHTFEPGDTVLGRHLRSSVLDGRINITPIAELFLFAADRAQHVEHVIKPALAEGKWVVCDRYIDSTVAYQMYGRGIPHSIVGGINSISSSGLMPDLTIWLEISVEDAFRRKVAERSDRIEQEDMDFHDRVAEGYRDQWRRNIGKIERVPASGSVDEVAERVRSVVSYKFGLGGR